MIRILVDSSADYTMAELKENGFDFVPFPVTLNDKTYLDTVELDRNDMYKFLLQGEHFPKTSQPSPEAFVEIFEDAKGRKMKSSASCFPLPSVEPIRALSLPKASLIMTKST